MTPTVCGIDLSLTSTGLARINETGLTTSTFKPKTRGYDRLRMIRDEVLGWLAGSTAHAAADLVVVEGPSFGSTGSAFHQLGGLWWFVTEALDAAGSTWTAASPSSVKTYATGKGNAGKDAVLLAAARRFAAFDGDNNQADAAWLAALGAERLGCPLASVPQSHLRALASVPWPEFAIGGAA